MSNTAQDTAGAATTISAAAEIVQTSAPLVVDSLSLCVSVCRALRSQPLLAVDLEGVNLGREGRVSVLQIATRAELSFFHFVAVSDSEDKDKAEKEEKEKEESDNSENNSNNNKNNNTHNNTVDDVSDSPAHTHTHTSTASSIATADDTHTFTPTQPHTQTHTPTEKEKAVRQQVKKVSARVFLFDITTLGESAFHEGQLSAVLGSAAVPKLFFDLRKDADALFHAFGVELRNALDLQILFFHCFPHKPQTYTHALTHAQAQAQNRDGRGRGALVETQQTSLSGGKGRNSSYSRSSPSVTPSSSQKNVPRRVTSFKHAMQRLLPQGDERFAEVSEVKERGRALFSPAQGGDFAVWERRPLHPDLVEYCRNDVLGLFEMYDEWSLNFCKNKWAQYSENRLQRTIAREQQWADEDEQWTLPDWF